MKYSQQEEGRRGPKTNTWTFLRADPRTYPAMPHLHPQSPAPQKRSASEPGTLFPFPPPGSDPSSSPRDVSGILSPIRSTAGGRADRAPARRAERSRPPIPRPGVPGSRARRPAGPRHAPPWTPLVPARGSSTGRGGSSSGCSCSNKSGKWPQLGFCACGPARGARRRGPAEPSRAGEGACRLHAAGSWARGPHLRKLVRARIHSGAWGRPAAERGRGEPGPSVQRLCQLPGSGRGNWGFSANPVDWGSRWAPESRSTPRARDNPVPHSGMPPLSQGNPDFPFLGLLGQAVYPVSTKLVVKQPGVAQKEVPLSRGPEAY
ncbi:translation initiation factor IF-2-like [Herpailurus yagouaroundi]|uniref:translation initiation factor IF-2-like n=1 Tax=Herpailurus yagouaroundi TaxID=1608482 RepID=UPI001AD755E6|nr:translation initiation factor IF-2-like [Puma yagouaroundi]